MVKNKYIYNNFVSFFFLFGVILLILLIFLNIFKNKIENFNINNSISNNKYACLYVYYEKNNDYKDNFKYFLDNVLLKKDDIDYYIIINGICTVDLPNETQNIKIIRRENEGFDFGAWSYCIKNYISKIYDYYIFINTSIKGPYPSNIDWLPIYLDLFKTGPNNVKLVGTSINILSNISEQYKYLYEYNGPYTHIQSMFFILDKEGFNILNNEKFFDDEDILNKNKDISYIIFNKEVKMSQILLRKGYNINSILSKYKDIDYTKITKNFNTTSEDPYFKDAYFGNTISKEDVIFFKNNRL